MREILSSDDKAGFEKGYFGAKMGFGKKPAVIVVDMTNEFVDTSYSLAHGNLSSEAAENIRKLLVETRSADVQVIYSRAYNQDIHPALHGISRKWTSMPSKKDPRANEITRLLKPQEKDVVIEKGKASVFFGTPLQIILTSLGIDTLIVTGVTTSGCVRATVIDAASFGYHVIVPIECCGDRSVISHKVNLVDMHMKYADVLTLSEVINYLKTIKVTAAA